MKRLIAILSFGLVASAPVRAEEGFTLDKKRDAERGTIYSPIGKRDPFKSPSLDQLGKDLAALNPLERFSIEQFQLRAILKGLGKSRAMLEDPEGHTYIIGEGMTVGRERATVSRILDKGVVLTERTFNYLGQESLYEKVISLPQNGNEGVIDEAPAGRRGKRGAAADDGPFPNGPNGAGPAAIPVGMPFPMGPPAAAPAAAAGGGGGANAAPAPPTNPAPAAQNNPAPAAPVGGGGGGNPNPLIIPQAPAAQNIGGGGAAPPAAAQPATITNKGGGLTY